MQDGQMPDALNTEVFVTMVERAANSPAQYQEQWFALADAALRGAFSDAGDGFAEYTEEEE